MAWLVIKTVARETFNVRMLLLASAAAVVGGVLLAGIGVALVHLALRHVALGANYQYSIQLIAAIGYAVIGAIAGVQTAMTHAITRALRSLRPTLHPLAARAASAATEKLAPASGGGEGVEIARIDQLIDAVFDQMRASADLPVVRSIATIAAAVARWRVRRQIDPYLAPLLASGHTPINRQTLETHLADAGCNALIGVATAQVVRTRLLIWSLPAIALLVPLLIWAWRAMA